MPENTKKLTKRDIDLFTYKGGWDVRWDSVLPGFGVRVYPSGKKAYVLSYRHGNRKRLLTLGQCNKIALDKARDLAFRNLAELADKIDPMEERRRSSAGRNVENVFIEFLERYAKPKNRSWQETERIFKSDVLPTFGKRSIHEISKQDVIKLIDKIVDRGSRTMANRTLAHMRKFFNWCVARGIIDTSPAFKIPLPSPEFSRDRALTDGEIKEVWQACEEEGYPYGTMLQFLLATAQRREEAATIRWQDINWNNKLWTIARENNKSNRKHEIHLSALAMEILDKAKNFGDFVFTTEGNVPFSGFSKAKRRLDSLVEKNRQANRINSNMQEWRVHDLRRTAASGIASVGTSPHVIERILNHSSGIISGVAAVYNRYDYKSEIENALEAWGGKLVKITT